MDPPHKYPWMVGLKVIKDSALYNCGGSIISHSYILTAAHCFFDESNQLIPTSDVMVGIADHRQSSTDDDVPGVTREVRVQEVIIFRDYNDFGVDFDIALIKLQEPLDFTAKEVGPICLPENDDQTFAGIQSTAVGWGLLVEGGNQPDVLMEVQVPILEAAACQTMYAALFDITERMICAGLEEGGKDACEGDSGGPLSVVEGGRHVLVGITSFGEGCARPEFPGVYARVSKFLNWIKENTADATFCP